MAVLKDVACAIQALPDVMGVLQILDPLAKSLIDNKNYEEHPIDQIMERLCEPSMNAPKQDLEDARSWSGC